MHWELHTPDWQTVQKHYTHESCCTGNNNIWCHLLNQGKLNSRISSTPAIMFHVGENIYIGIVPAVQSDSYVLIYLNKIPIKIKMFHVN